VPDLGLRKNVMGPQPIAQRAATPPEMLEAANRFMQSLAGANADELLALTVEKAHDEVRRLVEAARETGTYERNRIVASARTNRHYWIKAELTGAGKPFIVQLRLGEQDGRWKVWETMNLTNARSAWTR
jgi:hypothetical protein